jgi:hypothetical protein
MSGVNIQLKSHAFQRAASALQYSLSSGRRASEADLVNSRVACEPGSQIIVTTQRLHDTRGKEFLGQFNKLQATVWGKGPASHLLEN